MDFQIVATGSKGNAVVLRKDILIDCGVPFKKIEPVLKGLDLVLCSHWHQDHMKPSTVREVARRRPSLRWGCCEWMVEPLRKAGVRDRQIDVYQFEIPANYGPFAVTAYPLKHDVPNCGYLIDTGSETAFYATDTASLDHLRIKADLYLIEANYRTDEIRERIVEKERAGEFVYEKRVLKTHLSEEAAIGWLAENMGPDSEYVFLHQHKEDNHADEIG